MTAPESSPVEQVDREAAADLIAAQLGPSHGRHAGPDRARSGASDAGLMVQAFARHRLRARTEADQRVREALFNAAHVFERLAALTPARANAKDAHDLHLSVQAIAETALAAADAALTGRNPAVNGSEGHQEKNDG